MIAKKIIADTPPEQGQDAVNDGYSSALADWMGDCRIVIRNALCGREAQREAILAGLGVRNKGQAITEQQREEIMRRLARGDQLRELAADWIAADQVAGKARYAGHLGVEDATMRPRRLAYLATLRLAPQPPEVVAERLRGTPRRGLIDFDSRMAQAAELVAAGGSW